MSWKSSLRQLRTAIPDTCGYIQTPGSYSPYAKLSTIEEETGVPEAMEMIRQLVDGLTLSEAEVGALGEALDDEYRAWAIYDQVVPDLDTARPFVNIRDAEARHIAALTTLFRRYSLAVPENRWPGRVPRYESLSEACAAGIADEVDNATHAPFWSLGSFGISIRCGELVKVHRRTLPRSLPTCSPFRPSRTACRAGHPGRRGDRGMSQLFGAPSVIHWRIVSIVSCSRNGPPCGIRSPTLCVPSSLWIR